MSNLFRVDEVTPLCAEQYGRVDKLKGEPPIRFAGKPHAGPIPIPEGYCGCSQTEEEHWHSIQTAYLAGYTSERGPALTSEQAITPETPEQKAIREYVEAPTHCPHCGSTDISAGQVEEADERSAWCAVHCPKCNSTWQEVFTLSSIEETNGDPFKLNPLSDEDKYPLCDWKHEVANGDTKLGYAEWVQHRKEAEVQP